MLFGKNINYKILEKNTICIRKLNNELIIGSINMLIIELYIDRATPSLGGTIGKHLKE